jgi:hypothetical protein
MCPLTGMISDGSAGLVLGRFSKKAPDAGPEAGFIGCAH